MPDDKSRDVFSRFRDWWESTCNKFPILNIINILIVIIGLCFLTPVFLFLAGIPCGIASAIIDSLSISDSAKHRAKKVAHSAILALTVSALIVGICIKCAPAEPRHTSSPKHTTMSSSVSSLSGSSSNSCYGGSVYKASATTRPTRAPTPTPRRTPEADNAYEIIVYVTDTGDKYHSEGCQYLRRSCYAETLEDAINEGYTPCSRCHPPR